jgi:D-alanyl-D-alanine carboxypeptidase
MGTFGCSSDTKEYSNEIRGALGAAVKAEMDLTGAPAVIVGVWSQDGTWIGAMGKKDVSNAGALIAADDDFRVGSITKMFIADVILQLSQEKKLDLDDLIVSYVENVPGSDNISIRDLLNHTSGLFDYTQDEDWSKAVADNLSSTWTPQQLVDIAVKHDPYFPPGQGWHYSNTNYIILGMIVESASGNTLSYNLRSRIINKLALTDTYLPDTTTLTGSYVHGYWMGPEGTALTDATIENSGSWAWAAGGMVSNIYDLKAYVQAAATGRLMSPDMQEQRMRLIDTKQTYYGLPMQYGLGISKLGNMLGHDGFITGYQNAAYTIPEKNITVVVCLTKSQPTQGSADELAIKLVNIVSPGAAGP